MNTPTVPIQRAVRLMTTTYNWDAPLLGSMILGEVSHLPAQDWRIGSTFYLCAIMQTLGIIVAWRYFQAQRQARLAVSTTK